MLKKMIVFLIIIPAICFSYNGNKKNETKNPNADTLKIHPIGDSITRGTRGDTYRNYLKTILRDHNIEVDFVGQCSNAANSGSVWADYPDLYNLLEGDIEHDGYGGLRIDQLTDMTYNTRGYPQKTIEQLVIDNPSDIILLMMGTNDIISQFQLDNAPARLDTLIRKILNSTSGHLIVSNITPTPLPLATERINTLNSFIPAIVDSYKTLGKNISFIDINSMLGNSDISDDSYHPNSQGYENIAKGWYEAITPLVSSIEENTIEGKIPEKYELMQNYPNPFNPSTIIKYGLSEQSNIKIEIFNMLGQSVAKLVDTEKSAGYYETTWNADNLPSGVYLISNRAVGLDSKNNFIQVKKALLLK
ncbi:MAG: T9SS type A sorting domain-containing protein [Bacteroidetes bacterium]|nr:T9SS type A sorting domain-containing protein [Bacteroidota bacterium]MBU1116520.1 T9SS type A sorting domain-containing protein [Bacteroidota bacterium]MBU1798402.1 T9SS type A sorting domain-containing protein [Bacteroidota bacterium]